ncbi:MAG TPA: response regulator transcription factor [Blastocatellia bacterium]|nr:response regulator transcription factor [Blastocatellia bacterium]
MLIDQQPNLRAISIAGELDGESWSAANWLPDIIVFDLDPSINGGGFGQIPELLRICKGVPILVLVSAGLLGAERRAMQFGAAGVVFREQTVQIFLKAIERVSAGENWFSRALLNSLVHQMFSSELAQIRKLSEREHQVIALVAKGFKNQQIAAQLSISEATVRHHLTSIYQKLDVADRSELIVYAYEHFLAPVLVAHRS